jgi:hypothetical protein
MTGERSITVLQLLRRMIRVSCNERCDLRRAVSLKPLNGFLQHAIGVGDTLMLAQVFKPGFDQEMSPPSGRFLGRPSIRS